MCLVAAAALVLSSSCDSPQPPPGVDPVPTASRELSGFTDIAGDVGIDFRHFIGATGEHYFPEIMGSGCALLDYDNDGDLDVYLVQGAFLGLPRRSSNRSFRTMGWLHRETGSSATTSSRAAGGFDSLT